MFLGLPNTLTMFQVTRKLQTGKLFLACLLLLTAGWPLGVGDPPLGPRHLT